MGTAAAGFGIGATLFLIGISICVFLILVFIVRWIFGIGKIVDLLGVIAQELRAANAVNGIDKKLRAMGIDDKLGDYLNKLGLKEYKIITKAPDVPSAAPPTGSTPGPS